jgi:hypothetical protein
MRVPKVLLGLLLGASVVGHAADDPVQFNRDIRPIMSDTCFHCHGFDAKARKGGLRLDLREEALKAGKSGALAIVPGKPDESEVIKRLFSKDEDDVMPSKESHKTLTEAQRQLFRRWIAQGAVYEPHWAYSPLKAPVVPPMPEGGRNPIDAFIGAKLAEKQMTPSAEASKERLLRRVSLDLTGLPPTPEELKNFQADTSADAYEKQVERLLTSPHFGERMAVWWLDVARFADTVGFHGDQNQRIFPYRDYIINAFNQNKPFNVFTEEQLAGDLLPNATEEQKVASGYNRLNMMTREGGAQAKEYLAKYGAERVRSVSSAWLGSTFGCAECHDHKFDPIKSADFYSLQSFFADVKQWGIYATYGYTPVPELAGYNNDSPFPPEIKVKSPYLIKRDRELRAELESFAVRFAQDALADAKQQAAYDKWLVGFKNFTAKTTDGWLSSAGLYRFKAGMAVAPKKQAAKVRAETAAKNVEVKDDVVTFTAGQEIKLSKGPAKGEELVVELTPGAMRLTALKLSVPASVAAGAKASFGVALSVRDAAGKERKLALTMSDATVKTPRYSNGAELLGLANVWGFTTTGKAESSVWQLDTPVDLTDKDTVVIGLDVTQTLPFTLAVTSLGAHDPLALLDAANVKAVIENPTEATLKAQWALGSAALRNDADYKALVTRLRECRHGDAWSLVTEVMAPLTIRVLPRGNWQDESGPVVLPATPAFLPGHQTSTDSHRLTRLDLAHWICSSENPITSRTVMNRLWQIYFGTGLSASLDDLGSQGEWPSHPELLDWLATEFRDHGWDMKKMIRTIVTSRTYRQSSSLRPEYKDRDPNNRLLASQNPRRLEAEFVRDNALAIAGLLNAADIGGPSVKPYQPDGYYEPLQFPNRKYVASRDQEQWRRGLYMHWQRTFLHPMLVNFDAPTRDECTALRIVSNTPQQALTLLNDPTFVEAARVWATHLMEAKNQTFEQRLEVAYLRALNRAPKAKEVASLQAFYQTQLAYYKANEAEVLKLVKTGYTPVPNHPTPELAAWTEVCRVILNTHEVITRY